MVVMVAAAVVVVVVVMVRETEGCPQLVCVEDWVWTAAPACVELVAVLMSRTFS